MSSEVASKTDESMSDMSQPQPSNVTDEVESKDDNDTSVTDVDVAKDDVKQDPENDDDNGPYTPSYNDTSDKEFKMDFAALDEILFAESPAVNTNTLSFDSIEFATDEERNGAMDLQSTLRSEHKLTNLPPFEMARFYIGSKCRIPKATQKWIDTIGLYKTHNLKDVTEQQMIKCFRESMFINLVCFCTCFAFLTLSMLYLYVCSVQMYPIWWN